MSYAQRKSMPAKTNWVSTIYHGIDETVWKPNYHPTSDYVAYLGRIIEPKGVHLAIAAIKSIIKRSKNIKAQESPVNITLSMKKTPTGKLISVPRLARQLSTSGLLAI